VKWFIGLSSVFASLLCAQESSVSKHTSVDINGHRVVEGPDLVQRKSAKGSDTTEIMQSVNGRMVPLQRIDEKVLRDDANGRLVERTIRRYDPTGNPDMPVKETIEEQKRPDGSATIQTTTYRTDLNGHPELIEKSTTEVRASGATENRDTVIQRPSPNGSLEAVEKRSIVTVKDAGGYHAETTKSLRAQNGGFYVAVKQSTEHVEQGAQSNDNTVEYEMGFEGRLEMHTQTVTQTVTRPDGSKDVEVDVFGRHVPGTVEASAAGKLKLFEQQLIEKRKGPNDSVVETLSVRRPSVSDPKVLGPAQQLSETVCRGKCEL